MADASAAHSGAPRRAPAPVPERYSRQVLFPPIGEAGQRRLLDARVAIVGVGATGAMLAGLLARAGVGTLRLIDRDVVDATNLQRQLLYTEADAADGTPKALAARSHLLAANAGIVVEAEVADVTSANIVQLLHADENGLGFDLLLDGTDNFETRFLLNDFAVAHGVPWIYTAALGSYAATMNVLPRPAAGHDAPWQPTACLACLFPAPPAGNGATCDTGGILAAAVTLAASVAAAEALKLLTGNAAAMRRTLWSQDLWSQDAWTGEAAQIRAGTPVAGCPVCDDRHFKHLSGAARAHVTLCGRNSVQIHEHGRQLDLPQLAAQLAAQPSTQGSVRFNALTLRLQLPAHVLTVFPDGRTLVQGTTDPAVARSLYARYVGA